jgi:hypothetical protein
MLRCSAVPIEDIVPFEAIQQVIKVAFEDGARKVTEPYDLFIEKIVGRQTPSMSR